MVLLRTTGTRTQDVKNNTRTLTGYVLFTNESRDPATQATKVAIFEHLCLQEQRVIK